MATRLGVVVVLTVLAAACAVHAQAPAAGPAQYSIVPPVDALAPIKRPKPGDALRPPMYPLAEAGAFDAKGTVVIQPLASERGYEAIFLGIPSADAAKGARLAVYSVPAQKVVTLAEDINLLLADRDKGAAACQRSIAPAFVQLSVRRSVKVYFGTGDSPEPAGYTGGHVVEFDVNTKEFRDLGAVAAGWSIHRVAQLGADTLLVAVSRSRPAQSKLYRFNVGTGAAEDLGIEDVADFWRAGDNAWDLSGQAGLRRWQPGRMPEAGKPEPLAISPAAGLQMPASPAMKIADSAYAMFADSPLLLRTGGAPVRRGPQPTPAGEVALEQPPADVAAALKGTAPACSGWLKNLHWSSQAYPNSPLAKGALYLAPTPRGGGAELVIWTPQDDKARKYAPVLDAAGKPMQQPLALSLDRNNDLYLVGQVAGALRLAVIEDTFLDEIIALDDQRVQQACAQDLAHPLRAKAWSMIRVADHLDRPYDAIAVASDGTVYCGAMPHHPTRGSLIFRYDPKLDQVVNLGDIDVLSGEKEPRDVPGMMHSTPTEAGGYMFFTGQDPFYGSANRFPELPKGMGYPGSHVLGFDLKNKTFRDFGIAVAGRSLFYIAGDKQRNLLYVRADYGHGKVYRMDLATGKVTDVGLDCPTSTFLVGADGKLYFSRDRDLVCYDPEQRTEAVVAAGAGRWEWLKGQNGAAEAYGISGGQALCFNSQTHELRRFGTLPDSSAGGDVAYRNGILYAIAARMQGGMRVSRLYTLNAADGKLTEHGVVVDQKGRIANEINAIDVGADGTVYMAGQFWPKPGDGYAPRLKPPYRDLADDCFIAVKGVKP